MVEWHDIREPNDPRLDQLAARYNLHALHIEDCRHRNQSAKVDESDSYLFVVLKPMSITAEDEVQTTDFDLFVGRDFVITVQESEDSRVCGFLNQIRNGGKALRPDQLLYRIADALVDSYMPLIEHFGDAIDKLEDEVLANPTPAALARIFCMKRGLAEMRRVMANTRDVANHLQRIEGDLIQHDMLPYLRDIYDHAARALDLIEMQRDLVTGALDIYLSSVANRTNNVMKALTMLGTVTLPVLLVTSFYGMNVEKLPLAHSPHGLFFVALVMAALTGLLAVLLRYFRWL